MGTHHPVMRAHVGSGAMAPRLLWPDVARGIAVALVVYAHVVGKHVASGDWDVHGTVAGVMQQSVLALGPIRMPLFFLISGMFGISAVQRSWPVLLRSKAAFFYYLYVLWLLIHTAVFVIIPTDFTVVATGPLMLLSQATTSPSTLWYLY